MINAFLYLETDTISGYAPSCSDEIFKANREIEAFFRDNSIILPFVPHVGMSISLASWSNQLSENTKQWIDDCTPIFKIDEVVINRDHIDLVCSS